MLIRGKSSAILFQRLWLAAAYSFQNVAFAMSDGDNKYLCIRTHAAEGLKACTQKSVQLHQSVPSCGRRLRQFQHGMDEASGDDTLQIQTKCSIGSI